MPTYALTPDQVYRRVTGVLSNVALFEYPREIHAEPDGWFGRTGPCSTD